MAWTISGNASELTAGILMRKPLNARCYEPSSSLLEGFRIAIFPTGAGWRGDCVAG